MPSSFLLFVDYSYRDRLLSFLRFSSSFLPPSLVRSFSSFSSFSSPLLSNILYIVAIVIVRVRIVVSSIVAVAVHGIDVDMFTLFLDVML